MKHLRLFETEAAFEAAKANFQSPWVALTEDDKKSHFMEKPKFSVTVYYDNDANDSYVACAIDEEYGESMLLNEYLSYSKLNGVKVNNDIFKIWAYGLAGYNNLYIDGMDEPFIIEWVLKQNEIPHNMFNLIEESNRRHIDTITKVEISNGITSIGDYAFSGCLSLTSITYSGTIAQWNEITKGEGWHASVPATSVTCTDGTTAL